MAYTQYRANVPMAQATNPNYSFMSGGDYDKLQSNLQQPGEIAANTAYNQGYNNLTNTMGGRGLYGSSIMQNQATNSLDRVLQDTLATNAAKAAATRYGMQQTELSDYNKFLSQNYATDVTQNKNLWASGAADAERRAAYDTAQLNWNKSYQDQLRDWQNKQQAEQFAYNKEASAYQNQIDEAMMNRALALAGQGAPLSQAGTNYNLAMQQAQAARDAANQASSAASTGSYLGAAGTVAGGLLGSTGFWDWMNS
jgi:hypothetical protein